MHNIYFFLLCILISGCSVVGKVAETSFHSASKVWAAQPKDMRKEYPLWIRKKFYTSELLVTPINQWKIKIVSEEDIAENIKIATLSINYEHDETTHSIDTVLTLQKRLPKNHLDEFEYVFSIDEQVALDFWQEYNRLLFVLEKPWFNYFLQPSFSIDISSKIKRIEYQFVSSFDYLTLREFMNHFDFIDDTKWQSFCSSTEYFYPKVAACGEVTLSGG